MNPNRDPPADGQHAKSAAALASSSSAPRELWLSEELLGNRKEILIKHGAEIYRLRRTRQGKLILHK